MLPRVCTLRGQMCSQRSSPISKVPLWWLTKPGVERQKGCGWSELRVRTWAWFPCELQPGLQVARAVWTPYHSLIALPLTYQLPQTACNLHTTLLFSPQALVHVSHLHKMPINFYYPTTRTQARPDPQYDLKVWCELMINEYYEHLCLVHYLLAMWH